MAIERTFKLFLYSGASAPLYINANQYDSGETWLFELYFPSGARYIPETGSIIGIKADGKVIANVGTIDSEGRVVIEETEQMTAAPGNSVFELLIDEMTHGTANFVVAVEKRPGDNAAPSDSDLSLIQRGIDAAAESLRILETFEEETESINDELVNLRIDVDHIFDYMDNNAVYGFIEHCDVLSPSQRIEYIGFNKDFVPLKMNLSNGSCALNGWENFPFLLKNKPWMVKSDGTPDYQLNEDDYRYKASGGDSDVDNVDYDGGAFAWIPKIYKKEVMYGNDRYVYFSMNNLPDFKPIGFKGPDGEEREGVWLPMYYSTLINDKYRSLATGAPDQSHNTAQQNTYIKNFSQNAYFLGGGLLETLIDIMIMLSKTTDLQGAFGHGNMSGGNSAQYMLDNAVIGGGAFYGTSNNKALNKVFHSLVLITQNQYQRDPYEVIIKNRVKVGLDYNYDPTGATYLDTGIDVFEEAAPSNGWKYPHVYKTVSDYGAIPIIEGAKGSTSLGGCDGVYTSASQKTADTVCLRFAVCSNGANGGPRARNWNNTATNTNWNIGAAANFLS